jgi:hypothetical protein
MGVHDVVERSGEYPLEARRVGEAGGVQVAQVHAASERQESRRPHRFVGATTHEADIDLVLGALKRFRDVTDNSLSASVVEASAHLQHT